MKRNFLLNMAVRGRADNPKVWSGTPFQLKKQFDLNPDIEMSYLDWELPKFIRSSYFKIWGAFFNIRLSSKDPLLNIISKYLFLKKFSKLNNVPDYILFISDFCIPDAIADKCNYAIYTDAFVPLIAYMDRNKKKLGYKFFMKTYTNNYKQCLNNATVIFTQNDWSKKGFTDNLGIEPSKVFNVGFGVNLDPYNGQKDYNDELLLIVLRKGTEKYKGLFLLLDAFKILIKGRPKVKLAVVGTEMSDKIDGVTCYYNYPRSKTEELFKQATLYVMPALHEPNGITYLEALANKTPIVGLNRFAFPEFSNNGEWGFYIDKEDPVALAEVLDTALSDKEKLKQMGEKGQKFVINRYRWDIVANKMITIMKQNK